MRGGAHPSECRSRRGSRVEPSLQPPCFMQQHEALGTSAWPVFERALDDLDRPLLAVAVHDGGYVRDEVRALLAIAERDRRREEDPCSASWAAISPNRLVALRSRF